MKPVKLIEIPIGDLFWYGSELWQRTNRFDVDSIK